ncbi:substrate-binding periplasmic protein [Litoribrevibacter euphylliae]|uniref:Substrate-binding periplasmic protein n=1 Tax=Litoribrevibacter euphylliae TaxID=1834034 RepID=A0ABV7HJ45_9GAMM
MFRPKKSKKKHGLLIMLIKVFVLLFASAVTLPSSSAAQAPPFIIAGTSEPPFKMKTDFGIEGIDVSIVSHIMKQLDIDYDIQLIESGARIIREAELGRIDMVMSFSFKPSRTDYLIYPQQSYKKVSWHFFVHKDKYSNYQFERLSDLHGADIGAVNEWAYTPEFWNSGLTIMPVSKHTLLITMLLRSRVDLAPMNTLETLYDLKRRGLQDQIAYLPKPLIERPYFNVIVKHSNHPMKNRVIKEYDRLVKRLIEQGYIHQVYETYLGGGDWNGLMNSAQPDSLSGE